MNKETVQISKLQSNKNNPRYIRDDKFKKLVKSLTEFPEMLDARPLVVNTDYEVLGGNMRLEALKKSGAKQVEVLVVDWTEEKQKEFIAKDNINYGDWDWESLSNEWDTDLLVDWGIDGFNFGSVPELIDIPEMPSASTPQNAEAKITDVGFVKFEVVMREEQKDFLLMLLNDIKNENNCNLGEALFTMVQEYSKSKVKQ
jgi:hypothetical protein